MSPAQRIRRAGKQCAARPEHLSACKSLLGAAGHIEPFGDEVALALSLALREATHLTGHSEPAIAHRLRELGSTTAEHLLAQVSLHVLRRYLSLQHPHLTADDRLVLALRILLAYTPYQQAAHRAGLLTTVQALTGCRRYGHHVRTHCAVAAAALTATRADHDAEPGRATATLLPAEV
ncbi:hypothetical protein ACFV6F_11880 [Kitasatospora phosalacinea]|uniref:hypothetical protein n=1 Tax=Kitasatospora phosalacinea TaxID=2065 RepID=UPI00364BF9D2